MEHGIPELLVEFNGTTERIDPAQAYLLGRDPESNIPCQEATVSWRHARIYWSGSNWFLQDLNSTNGIYAHSQRVTLAEITNGAVFSLGGEAERLQLRFTIPPKHPDIVRDRQTPAPRPTLLPSGTPVQAPRHQRSHDLTQSQGENGKSDTAPEAMHQDGEPAVSPSQRQGTLVTYIGRSPDNDLVIRDPEVSPHHAEFRFTPASYEIIDLGTPRGTYVNGHRVERAKLRPNDTLTVGSRTLRLVGDRLTDGADADEAPGLVVRRLTVKAKSSRGVRILLNKVSFAVSSKTLIAVVGPSGSGKSTLLRALTGHQRNVKGEVLYESRNLHERFADLRQHIGIVPQHDILHPQLSARAALRHAARLRFPRDTNPAERDRRVEEVLSELRLDLHADKRIITLSGGQRKRVSVALELLTKPSLMFLDEPTSGLDPGMDRDVMQLLRRLADDGKTILVVTHSTRELELCDKVLVLGPGGSVAYFGPPDEALEFFGRDSWADVFSDFEKHSDRNWSGRWRESHQYVASAAALKPAAPAALEVLHAPKPPRWTAQLFTLVRRYLEVMAADKGFIGLMALLPVVLGLANTVIPADFGLRRPPDGTANVEAGTILVSLAISMSFIGSTNSVRELVKERAIYERERAAGLSRSAYLVSKITVLGLITGLQGMVLCAISFAPRKLPTEGVVVKGTPAVEMAFVIAALGLTSMMFGLVISSLVKTAESTMPLLVLFSVVQYLFSGIVFKLFDNPGVEQMAWLAPSRWAIAAHGATLDLGQLLGPQGRTAHTATDPLWHHTLDQWLTDTGALLVTAIICYLLTICFLRRHEPEVVRKR
ncbi:ATP-binding cassette domain-containing protein [Streptomyces sp. NBC_01410]